MRNLVTMLLALVLAASLNSAPMKITNAQNKIVQPKSVSRNTLMAQPDALKFVQDADGQSLDQLRKKEITFGFTDTGLSPEGDCGQYAVFTPDNQAVAFCNRMSDNVTVQKVPEGTVIKTLDFSAGDYPGEIAINNEFAVVSLVFGNKVEVYRTADWSLAASFATASHPFAVRIAANKAFVACEGADVLEIINLATLTKTSVQGMPWGIAKVGGGYAHTRTTYYGHELIVTQDGKKVISHEQGGSGVSGYIAMLDVESGIVKKFTESKFQKCAALGLSGDGTKLIAATSPNAGVYFLQFDLSTMNLTKEIFKSGEYIFAAAQCAVNQNGNKAICPGGNNDWKVNFETQTAVAVTNYDNCADQMVTSPDHTKAFMQHFRSYVLDLETGATINDFFQMGTGAGHIAVSPDNNWAVTFEGQSDEYARVLKYTNYHASFTGTFQTGAAPEGDAPRDIVFTPDGKKAVISNNISCSVTIYNMETKSVDAVIPCGDPTSWGVEAQNVAVTPDGKYALLTTYGGEKLAVIDLATNSLLTLVATGLGYPCQLAVSPDSKNVYLGSAGGDNLISQLKIENGLVTLVKTFEGPNISGTYGGDFCPMKVSPDGNTLFVSDAAGKAIKLFNTADGALIKEIPVVESVLYAAFKPDFSQALLCTGNGFALLNIDGINSAITVTQTLGGEYVSVANAVYNAVHNSYVLLASDYQDNKFYTINPVDGTILNQTTLQITESAYKVAIDKKGNELLQYIADNADGQEFKIMIRNPINNESRVIDSPIPFWGDAYNPVMNVYAGVLPGPDVASFIYLDTDGIGTTELVPLNSSLLQAYPNPFNPQTTITFMVQESSALTKVAIFNQNGELVKELVNSQLSKGRHSTSFDAAGLASGIYFCQLQVGNQKYSKKLNLIK